MLCHRIQTDAALYGNMDLDVGSSFSYSDFSPASLALSISNTILGHAGFPDRAKDNIPGSIRDSSFGKSSKEAMSRRKLEEERLGKTE